MSNSFDIPLRIQQSYTTDELYRLHVFSYRRPATNSGRGPRKQLIVFITRASEDSGQLDKLQVRTWDLYNYWIILSVNVAYEYSGPSVK